MVRSSKKGTTCGVWTPNHLANSYPSRSDCVAILDEDIFMTAAASFGDASSLPWTLKRAKKTTPPEFTVSYVDTNEKK
jgi:hypothetical protein